jgi:hypothetical protein
LFPGQLVEYGFEDPFLNLKIVEEVWIEEYI